MTIKWMKSWGVANNSQERAALQCLLDGGTPIIREGMCVKIGDVMLVLDIPGVFFLDTPGEAVKFAAALNRLRRPLHLIKQDLDKDWAARVKERDNQTCAICGVRGDKVGGTIAAHTETDEETGESREVKERIKKDVLTAHHWLKTKARAAMARWARPCGVTVHFAEHIHTLHENPCWVDLEKIYRAVAIAEGEEAIKAALTLAGVSPTEARVRALWLERCGNAEQEV